MMEKSSFRLRLCTTLPVCNLLFIWGNSLMSAEISARISGWVRQLLSFMMEPGTGGGENGDGILRKLAHFAEFAGLGLWLGWLFAMLTGSRKGFLPALGCGFAAGCIDECIQIFVPGRAPAVRDVLIDTLGVAAGLAALYGVWKLWVSERPKFSNNT